MSSVSLLLLVFHLEDCPTPHLAAWMSPQTDTLTVHVRPCGVGVVPGAHHIIVMQGFMTMN